MRPDADDAEGLAAGPELAGLEGEVDAAGRPAGAGRAAGEGAVASLLLAEAVGEGGEAVEIGVPLHPQGDREDPPPSPRLRFPTSRTGVPGASLTSSLRDACPGSPFPTSSSISARRVFGIETDAYPRTIDRRWQGPGEMGLQYLYPTQSGIGNNREKVIIRRDGDGCRRTA
ncbi:MAG: hypothetical protein GXY82_04240 [Methanospirillum sp.]|nr:hypothetical protein [Methanospirillum sp.]